MLHFLARVAWPRLSPGICSGSGNRPEVGPGKCCQFQSGSAKAAVNLSTPPIHLVHYWPSNLIVAVLITAKAQHELTETVGTVPQHVPECPLHSHACGVAPFQPGLQLWSGWDHPWDHSLLPQKAHCAQQQCGVSHSSDAAASTGAGCPGKCFFATGKKCSRQLPHHRYL